MTEDVPIGQLLVLHGDLTRLSCQAIVVPTSRQLQVTSGWIDVVPLKSRVPNRIGWYDVKVSAPPEWGDDDRALPVPVDSRGRKVWLARTDAHGRAAAWVVESLLQAVRRAASRLPPSQARALPLIGVPLAGAGDGGFNKRRGEVVRELVPALDRAAIDLGVDIALVLYDEQDHTAVQVARSSGDGPGRKHLSEAEVDRADDLGRRAAAGELVLFLGAGVSVAAGLPTWRGLLGEMTATSKLEHLRLDTLPAPEAAQVCAEEMGADHFRAFMKDRFTLDRHAPAHALLAGLQADAIVTTNYDNGFELAAQSVLRCKSPLRVLPREHAVPGAPWLLKMHGDVEKPDTIVLTRQHYLDYSNARAPLAGMVQSLLMTRHMLFVGFSLMDHNFARLAHQVRQVLASAGTAERRVGTVLALRHDVARERLWRADLDNVALAHSSEEGEAAARAHDIERGAARRLELFLDRLAWRATTVRGGNEVLLLDERYAAMPWTEAEKVLRARLQDLRKSCGDLRDTSAGRVLEEALRRLGA